MTIESRKTLSEAITVSFLFDYVYTKVTSGFIRLIWSIRDGAFFQDSEGKASSDELVSQLISALQSELKSSDPIEVLLIPRAKLLEKFAKQPERIAPLKAWQQDLIPCLKYKDYVNYTIGPLSTEKSIHFELKKLYNGFLLRAGSSEFVNRPAVQKVAQEGVEWSTFIQVKNVHDLNQKIAANQIDIIRLINEGLHEQKISSIAQSIVESKKLIVLVGGSSACCRETFSKRLQIQLLVSGYQSTYFDFHDYSKKEPLDSINDLDFDSLFKDISAIKHYVIVQGELALHQDFLSKIGREKVATVYTMCMPQISVDNTHRIQPSDLRLIRTIVKLGKEPRKTFRIWPNVLLRDEKLVYPTYSNADHLFNSALVYEIPVLWVRAQSLLSEAIEADPDEDPKSEETQAVTAEVRRLLNLLACFYPLPTTNIPRNSTLREIIGGSAFIQ